MLLANGNQVIDRNQKDTSQGLKHESHATGDPQLVENAEQVVAYAGFA